MYFTWSDPDQVVLLFLVGKRQEVGNFLARRAQKNIWGVNLRCRKDFACFLGKKCRICPSFQENMQDLANFLGRNVEFVGNFVARMAKKFFRGKYALQEGFCSRKGNQDQQENFKIAIQTYHPCIRENKIPLLAKDYVYQDWNFFPMVLETFTNTKPNYFCFANNRKF